jgi:hypothetical protein
MQASEDHQVHKEKEEQNLKLEFCGSAGRCSKPILKHVTDYIFCSTGGARVALAQQLSAADKITLHEWQRKNSKIHFQIFPTFESRLTTSCHSDFTVHQQF